MLTRLVNIDYNQICLYFFSCFKNIGYLKLFFITQISVKFSSSEDSGFINSLCKMFVFITFSLREVVTSNLKLKKVVSMSSKLLIRSRALDCFLQLQSTKSVTTRSVTEQEFGHSHGKYKICFDAYSFPYILEGLVNNWTRLGYLKSVFLL